MCHQPVFVFNQFGPLERCALRPGNVHGAHGWEEVLKPVMARYADRRRMRVFRADAVFAIPHRYEMLEAEGYFHAIRLRPIAFFKARLRICSNARWVDRPTMRGASAVPSSIGRRPGTNPVTSQPSSSGIPARCSLASASSSPSRRWNRTGSSASTITVVGTSRKASRRSTGRGSRARERRRTTLRLPLHALAYTLRVFAQGANLPEEVTDGSLTSLQTRLIKIGARVVRHARAIRFQLVEVAVSGDLFTRFLAAIQRLCAPPVCA